MPKLGLDEIRIGSEAQAKVHHIDMLNSLQRHLDGLGTEQRSIVRLRPSLRGTARVSEPFTLSWCCDHRDVKFLIISMPAGNGAIVGLPKEAMELFQLYLWER